MEAEKKESVKKEAVKKEAKPIAKAIAIKKEDFGDSNCKDHKVCPIQEYINDRLEDLEEQEAAAVNPLDRLEIRARIDELHEIIEHMEKRAFKGVIEALFEKISKK